MWHRLLKYLKIYLQSNCGFCSFNPVLLNPQWQCCITSAMQSYVLLLLHLFEQKNVLWTAMDSTHFKLFFVSYCFFFVCSCFIPLSKYLVLTEYHLIGENTGKKKKWSYICHVQYNSRVIKGELNVSPSRYGHCLIHTHICRVYASNIFFFLSCSLFFIKCQQCLN